MLAITIPLKGIAPREKTSEGIMGRRQNFFDKSVGLARSFYGAHWFLELAIT